MTKAAISISSISIWRPKSPTAQAIGWSKRSGNRDMPRPPGPISFILMQFRKKTVDLIIGWRVHLCGWRPRGGRSWISHFKQTRKRNHRIELLVLLWSNFIGIKDVAWFDCDDYTTSDNVTNKSITMGSYITQHLGLMSHDNPHCSEKIKVPMELISWLQLHLIFSWLKEFPFFVWSCH